MFKKKEDTSSVIQQTTDWSDPEFSFEDAKERILEKRALMKSENLEKVENLSEFNEEQKKAITHAVERGVPLNLVAKNYYDALKIYAIADAYETGASAQFLEQLDSMNFMQIRWCIIPAIEKEIEMLENEKLPIEERKIIELVSKDKLNKQMMLLKYMYESLVTGKSYIIHCEKEGKDIPEERFLINFSGKDSYTGYFVKRAILSHGYYEEVKPLLLFTIDNRKNAYGSMKMYSTRLQKNREADLNSKELDLFYQKTGMEEKIETLDNKISGYKYQIEEEKRIIAEERASRRRGAY